MIPLIVITTLTIVLTKLGLKLIPQLLVEGELVAKNYEGEKIPFGYGLLFALNIITILIIGSLLGYYSVVLVYRLLILILAMAFVGILDDTLGDKGSQGFNGHFKALFLEKKLTTGAIKAIFSFFIVLFINYFLYQNWLNIIINTALILLTSNFINLVDLRPGRALKIVLLFLTFILIGSFKNYLLVIPMIVIISFSFPFDLRAKGMMGDIGANVLGAIAGFLFILSFGIYFKLLGLFILIGVHIYAEFYSLSNLVEKNKVLNYFDLLGRDN